MLCDANLIEIGLAFSFLESEMTKRIALTGSTGFVGGHLLKDLLKQGFKVTALTRRPQQAVKNVRWINGDLQNTSALKELVKDADVIINVAGLVKAKSKSDFFKANTQAVSGLLDAMDTSDCNPDFIQISSLAAREAKISHYAESKIQGEVLVKSHHPDLKWTIIRPPGIYGPNDSETLKIFNMLKWRFALFPGSRKNRVSWIHVSDLVAAIRNIIGREEYYHKLIEIDDGSENGYSHEEFYTTASEILNVTPFKVTIPKFILKIIGHINDMFGRIFGYAPMMSAMKVNELCHDNWVCNKEHKITPDDWKAKHDLESGLKETLDWYKNNEYI